jgi:hypothetical protein
MADIERFEGRLAASLRLLADEAQTEVDAALVASTVAAAHPAGSRGSPAFGASLLRLGPSLRLAIVVALLALVAYLAITLAPRLLAQPLPASIHGLIQCDGERWTGGSTAVVLRCSSGLADSRLAGPVRLAVDPATAGARGRTGSIELEGSGGRWQGRLLLETSPDGMVVADASLTAGDASAGYLLQLHLISPDGLEWGVIGSVHAR